MDISLDKFVERVGVRGILASVALLLAYFIGDALIHEEAYAEIGYAVALFSVVGSAAGLGYLLFTSVGTGRRIFCLSSCGINHESGSEPDSGSGAEGLPGMVSLLYASICFLFAGLAGWVEKPV